MGCARVRLNPGHQFHRKLWSRPPGASDFEGLIELNRFWDASAAIREKGIHERQILIPKNDFRFNAAIACAGDRSLDGKNLCPIPAPMLIDYQPFAPFFRIQGGHFHFGLQLESAD